MTFLEACQQVVDTKAPGADYSTQYGVWRQSWPQDIILGMNDKKDAYANSPGVSVCFDTITSRAIVFSLSKTSQVSYIGWLPSVEDLTAEDWETNVVQPEFSGEVV